MTRPHKQQQPGDVVLNRDQADAILDELATRARTGPTATAGFWAELRSAVETAKGNDGESSFVVSVS